MRLILYCLSILLIIFTFPLTSAGAKEEPPAKIETVPVHKNIYMLQGRGGNIGVSIGPDGVLLIDDQMTPLNPNILASIKELNGGEVRFVINTHWHFDHTGGNEALGKAGAVIVAHENVRKRMSTDQFSEFMNRKFPASPPKALPIITFTRDVKFHLNGDTAQVFHRPPAHTDGDAVIWFESTGVVHLGDIYFNGIYPYIDTGVGGNINGVIAAVDWALEKFPANTKVIPGHGSLSNMSELKAYRDMLVKVRDEVAALKQQGKSLAETQAAKPTAAFDAKWGGGFLKPDQFVQLVYTSL